MYIYIYIYEYIWENGNTSFEQYRTLIVKPFGSHEGIAKTQPTAHEHIMLTLQTHRQNITRLRHH